MPAETAQGRSRTCCPDGRVDHRRCALRRNAVLHSVAPNSAGRPAVLNMPLLTDHHGCSHLSCRLNLSSVCLAGAPRRFCSTFPPGPTSMTFLRMAGKYSLIEHGCLFKRLVLLSNQCGTKIALRRLRCRFVREFLLSTWRLLHASPHSVSVTSREEDLADGWAFAEELRPACPTFDV